MSRPIGHTPALPQGLYTLLWLLVLAGCASEPALPPEAVPLSERFDAATQPYAFSLPVLAPVAGVGGVRAEDCGRCHAAHYAEWKGSTHAAALHDIQFQAEITKPDAPKWLCLNCHIPVANQRATLVTHLEAGDVLRPVARPNPAFDAQMQAEGVTCAACHVRRDEATGESYVVGPFETTQAPHPVRVDAASLRAVCLRCHNPQGEGLTRNLVCWFETEQELAAGRVALPDTLRQADCVTCHMPAVRRRVAAAPGLSERTSHRHWWTGGGVPKWYDAYDSLLARGFAPALEVAIGAPRHDADAVRVPIDLTNRSAGHALPTADPERYILVRATLFDAAGDTLARDSLRLGQTWAWDPARKIDDNRLAQGETRRWTASLPAGGARLEVTALHVRLNTDNARYLMQATGVDERLFPGGAAYVAHAVDHYPFATFIYKMEMDLRTGARRVCTLPELMALSKAEQGKSLPERDY